MTKPTLLSATPTDATIEAQLLASLRSDREQWDQNTVYRIANFRDQALFFCPAVSPIAKRAKPIAALAKKLGLPIIGEQQLTALAQREPLSLNKILDLQRLLLAIAHSNDPAVRSTTEVECDGRVAPLLLRENDVVPSWHWVNAAMLSQFRKHYGIKKKVLSRLIFGDHDNSEHVIRHLGHGIKIGSTQYDYRITPFTCRRIYFGLTQLFERLAHYRRPPLEVMPSQSYFFVMSPTAGAEGGRDTLALPVAKGNQLEDMTPNDESGIIERIDLFARSLHFPPLDAGPPKRRTA